MDTGISTGAVPFSASGVTGIKIGNYVVTEHAMQRYYERTKRKTVEELEACLSRAGVCWGYPVKEGNNEYALQYRGVILIVGIIKGIHCVKTVLCAKRGKKHVEKS